MSIFPTLGVESRASHTLSSRTCSPLKDTSQNFNLFPPVTNWTIWRWHHLCLMTWIKNQTKPKPSGNNLQIATLSHYSSWKKNTRRVIKQTERKDEGFDISNKVALSQLKQELYLNYKATPDLDGPSVPFWFSPWLIGRGVGYQRPRFLSTCLWRSTLQTASCLFFFPSKSHLYLSLLCIQGAEVRHWKKDQ